MPSISRVRFATTIALSTLLATAAATAQESPADIARRELIAQAEQASTAGNHAQAVELAQRAAQIRATPSVQYFLAREQQSLGHSVEALAWAGACARAAEADTALRNRDAILQACRDIATASEARVARLTVTVPSPAPPGLTVRVGTSELAPALWGIAYPVAPGATTVDATAPGMAPFHREVTTTAGQSATVAIALVAAPAAAVTTAAPPIAPQPLPTPPSPAARGPGAGPWIVAGVGVAGLALAGVFYGMALGARADRDAACQAGVGCDPSAQSHDDAYARDLTLTNVALGVGAAAVVGGAVWYFVGRAGAPPARATASLRWTVSPSPAGASVGLQGAF